jgi:ABC-2 type transport system permease protein
MNFLNVFRKEIMEQWRTRRFLIVVAVFVIFGMTSPLLAKFMPEIFKSIPGIPAGLLESMPTPTVADAVGQYVKNMNQFGILMALLVTMGVVVQEKERGTAAFFLTRPVSRETFVLAKFAALMTVFTAGVLIAALGCWYYTYLLFEALPWGPFLAANGLMLAAFMVYMSLSLLGSTLAKSQGVAVGIAVVALIVVSVVGSLPVISNYSPARLFGWAAQLFLGQNVTAWPAFGISLGIVVLALVMACVVFRRQEI